MTITEAYRTVPCIEFPENIFRVHGIDLLGAAMDIIDLDIPVDPSVILRTQEGIFKRPAREYVERYKSVHKTIYVYVYNAKYQAVYYVDWKTFEERYDVYFLDTTQLSDVSPIQAQKVMLTGNERKLVADGRTWYYDDRRCVIMTPDGETVTYWWEDMGYKEVRDLCIAMYNGGYEQGCLRGGIN